MSVKQRIRITIRGYKILAKYCPGLIESKIVASVIESILPFINIWFSARIVNEIANQQRLEMLKLYVFMAIIINFLLAMVKNIVDRISGVKESGMWNCFAKIFCDKQMNVKYSELENASYQHLKQKAEENLFMFGNGLGQLVWNTPGIVKIIVGIIASFALTLSLFTLHSSNKWLNSPIWIVITVGLIACGGKINDILKNKEQIFFEKWSNGTVWFNRAFSFYGQDLDLDFKRAKDVRIYRQDKTALNEIDKMIAHNVQEDGYITKMSLCHAISSFSTGIINSLCYLFVVLKSYYGAFPIGNMVQYISSIVKMTESFGELTIGLAENKICCGHLQKLFEFLDMSNDSDVHNNSITNNDSWKMDCKEIHIEFKNVSFKYPGTDTYALRNVSVEFRNGYRYAIVGTNGSGKTTFVKLLCRLYEPIEGDIFINGKNIKSINYQEYLKYLSVVFQDFQLFSFSIGESIAASREYDKDAVEKCIEKAGLYDRFKKMPDGLKTCLNKDFSDEGVEISGGEAQKIALARGLYKNAPIMVLDEPTSALDPIAEEEVYLKFNEITSGFITIFISHRLSSCKFCDVVIVFDEGKIVQRGEHGKLLSEQNGKYFELWNAQAQYYQNS